MSLASATQLQPVAAGPATALPDLSGRVILQVIPELDAGGAERTVLEVTEAIVRAGGASIVASRGGRMAGDLSALGGKLEEIDAKSKNPLVIRANARRLARLVIDRSVDLIHARSRAPAWSALWAARRTKTAFVTTYHGAYSSGSALKRLYNSVMARGDTVIANSAWIAEHVAKEHAVPPERLVTIARGVDLMAFDPDTIPPGRAQRFREAWGADEGEARTLLFLPGRLTEWKGQRLALRALAMLTPEERAGLLLVIAGDAQGRSGYVDAIEADMRALDLTDCVRLMPHCTDMAGAYLASDIVLAPSTRPEAFGRVAAEASAMRRPVIAADHGGTRETVIDGETGARFAPGDPRALAAAIRTIVSLKPTGWAGMGDAGRQHVAAHFSKRGLQAATLAVYARLIDAKRH